MAVFIRIIKNLSYWIIASCVAIFIGVLSQTQFVINRLNNLGADIDFSDRISTSFYDLQHLGSFYGLFIAVALAIAFLVSGVLYRFIKFGRPLIYAIAGGTAILVLLFAMKAKFFNIHIISGARDFPGISLQVIAGIIAGLIFAKLTIRK